MNSKKHWLIFGSGFRGLMGAYLLAKKGHKVTIIDKAKTIGGVISSVDYKGFALDKGCHLFDNDQDELTALFMEIMDSEVVPVKVKYASFLNGIKTDGFSIANLSSHQSIDSARMLYDILERYQQNLDNENSLKDVYQNRFGKNISQIIDDLLFKSHLKRSEELDTMAKELLPFNRINITNDKIGRLLKGIDYLDERIAVSSQETPLEFYAKEASGYDSRNFYPKNNGLNHFCLKVQSKLEDLGVDIQLEKTIEKVSLEDSNIEIELSDGNTISGDMFLWAAPQELMPDVFNLNSNLKEYVFGVPMVLYYFIVNETDVSDYSYVHNFNSHHKIFRASIPFNYGNHTGPNGKTYVCCEVPIEMREEIWKNPKTFAPVIWEELCEMSLVNSKAYDEVLAISIPKSYKVPLKGYKDELKAIIRQINDPRIIGLEDWEFTKNSIVKKLEKILSE